MAAPRNVNNPASGYTNPKAAGNQSATKSTASATNAAQQKAADQKLLEQAQALLAKQKATLAALEKQKAEAAAAAAAAAKIEQEERTALKLAEMKRVREAELASKSAARAAERQAEKDAAEKARKQNLIIPSSTGINNTGGATPDPTPSITSIATTTTATPVKTAPIDTVLFDDDLIPTRVMTDLIFEDIGGHELINIARNDIINGQDISYQPIKNLTSIQQQYNPNNILSLQSTSDKYFANFAIKLENKIPNVGNGPFGSNVYLDNTSGSLTVEAINLESDEQIEIEITLSGTIYEADLTGSES